MKLGVGAGIRRGGKVPGIVLPSIYTDFSGYTTGVFPTGWTNLAYNGIVAEVVGVNGGKVLKNNEMNTSLHMARWDDPGSFNGIDFEITTLVRTTYASTNSWIWLPVNMTDKTSMIWVALKSGNTLEIAKYTSALSYTQLVSASFNYSAGSWYKIKAKRIGSDYSAKAWLASNPEPVDYMITVNNTTVYDGFVGLGGRYGDPLEFDTLEIVPL